MATPDGSMPERIRRQIESERSELASAVDDLRAGLGEAANLGGKLRAKLPAAAAAALGAGFVLAGGVGATARLVFRRGREGDRKAGLGRFSLVERR